MIDFKSIARRILSRKFWSLQRIIIAGSLVLIGLLGTATVLRTQLAIIPTYDTSGHKVDAPFVVILNQKVKSLPLEDITVTPAIQGTWKLEEGVLLGDDSLVFTPAKYFAVSTEYTVSLPKIERAIAGTADEMSIQFKTEQAPSITDRGIGSLTDKQVIPADYSFAITLASPNRELRSLELRTKPALKLSQSSRDDKEFIWTTKDLLPQGTPIAIELYDAKNKTSLLTKTVRVANEPRAVAPKKTTHYRPGDAIELSFSEPIKPDQSSKITFDTPGEGSWKSEAVYSFTPKQMKPGQVYTYTIATGLRSKQGGISTAKHSDAVTAVGPVYVIHSTPQGINLAQASQRISFTFDQPVDKQSAVERLHVSSGEITRTEWSGNTLIATATNLGYQNTVTATIAPGVKNAGFGLPSTGTFRTSFTTEARSVRLNIPYFQQQYAASCTAASLRMILASKGVATSDMAIIERMGYSPRPMDKSKNPATWDDPNTMFVGDVNGSIRDGTGAGPDAQPVAKAAQSFGRNATAVTGIGTSWVAQQLYNSNPVVLFGAISGSGYIEWKTPSGAMTKMHVTGHARTITGVVGEPQNPIGFWVNDPLYGTQYWTAGSLAANIALDPYRQAVVVY